MDESLGSAGERFAALYLRSCGWDILTTNWRFGRNEIDLIATRKEMRFGQVVDVLNFVEVKTRTVQHNWRAVDAVSLRKCKIIARGARAYVQANEIEHTAIQFDVIGVVWSTRRVHHLKKVFDGDGMLF